MQQIVVIDSLMPKETKEDWYKEKDFTYMFETYYKRVYNFIYYRVNCHYTAEDLSSQVFEKIMISINLYSKEKSPFEAWLFSIARNVVNDYFRSLKRQKILSIDSIKGLVSKKKTPEKIVEIGETNEKLLNALKVLSDRERNIVALKFGAELKNKQIAETLKLTESNVGVILYRAMKKLKTELEREDGYGKR